MEVNLAYKHRTTVCLYEGLATAILLISTNLCKEIAGGYYQLICICWTVLSVIVIFGPVSGGHCNPCITFGVLVGYWGQKDFSQKALFCC